MKQYGKAVVLVLKLNIISELLKQSARLFEIEFKASLNYLLKKPTLNFKGGCSSQS